MFSIIVLSVQLSEIISGVDLGRDKRLLPVNTRGLVLFNNMIPHRSLPNVSRGIRWSLDLRWQRATDPGGLWGLKNGVVMRKGSDPNFKIDWTEFDAVNRHIVQTEYIKGDKAVSDKTVSNGSSYFDLFLFFP